MSQDVGYVLYSAFGSFYIPSCIMVFVYVKIYYAARDRARRNIKARRKSRRKSHRLQQANATRPGGAQGPVPVAPGPRPAAIAVRSPAPSSISAAASTSAHKSSIELPSPTATDAPKQQPQANGGVPTISGGTLQPIATSAASTSPSPTPSPLPSAMKRRTNSADSVANNNGTGSRKMTRFSFGEETVLAHRAAEAAKEDENKVKKAAEQKNGFAKSEEGNEVEKEVLLKQEDGQTQTQKRQPRKVHIMSAVSVSINDSPLADESAANTPVFSVSNAGNDEPPSSPSVIATSACPRHQNSNGLRVRRSIGVCTRGDRPDCAEEKANKNGGSNGDASLSNGSSAHGRPWGGKLRCAMLKSRFRVPHLPGRQRRPSKERREVLDTGRISRTNNNKPVVDDGISATATTVVSIGGNNNRSSVNVTPSHSAVAKSPSKPLTGNGTCADRSPLRPPPAVVLRTPVVPKPPPPAETEIEKEKKRVARKKERRATLILGLIMGSFIACWFPFFFLYSISPVCPICEESPESACCVHGWGFSFAFWLGYSNSALNPVIYTIFNKDFRRAFKRILFK